MSNLRRALIRFQKDPSSLRYATAAIISITVSLVVAGALVMRIFDSDEYPTFGEAVWFTLQTVTTVGYGDDTPTSFLGRLVASLVMLVSIGLITISTAVITSLFIQSAGRAGAQDDRKRAADSVARMEASLAKLHERLDHIERSNATADTPDIADIPEVRGPDTEPLA